MTIRSLQTYLNNEKYEYSQTVQKFHKKSLKDLIVNANRTFTQLNGEKNNLKDEQVTRNFAYASVVTMKKILKGEILSKKNIWVKRPGTGQIKAKDYFSILGKKASRNINFNVQLKKKDVK